MMPNKLVRRRLWNSAARLAAGSVVVVGASGVVGCLDRPIAPNEPRTTTTIVERLTQSSVDKIDLLLAIDNSRSMADKQQILALAVPDLVKGLVNPRCIDPAGVQAPNTPASPTEDCPTGMEREFDPVNDIHIGIISSSLGGHGSDACQVTGADSASNNDAAHLLARTDAGVGGQVVETYQGKGFLAWDPTQKLDGEQGVADAGDGEADLDNDTGADLNMTALLPQLTDMVIGVGQVGCGYEAQLESWYRFLIDPEPYQTIVVEGGNAVPKDIDTTLLAQRADFLRPDSLLAVILLSDENDCSIRESGQFFYAAQQNNANQTKFHLPRARSECATNPNDECCKSCGQSVPASCANDDANCKNPDGTLKSLSDTEDAINLRCFDQKRRFGIDFLYPIDRYTKALTEVTVPNRGGELVPNPIFTDLNPGDNNSNIRDAGLVFFAGIVGVPWQDIARQNAQGAPDLLSGLDRDGNAVGGLKNADELRQPNGNSPSTWDIILGDPTNYVPASDPHMIESIDPRAGQNPITGDSIAPPGSANGTDKINGHEWTIDNRGDLQYACIFDLLPGGEKDCSAAPSSCDCDAVNDNPLCEPNPADGGNPTLQTRAKAYPGTRELQVIKGLGSQGIVGSVCPAQLTNSGSPDFGYRPAIGAIIDRLKTALGGQCLPRTLTPNPDTGQVQCLILEVRNSQGQCKCDYAARKNVDESHQAAADAALADPIAKSSGWDCVCEIQQTTDDDLAHCQDDVSEPVLNSSGGEVNGWCYVDATTSPPTGNTDIVASCPDTEKRIIRFVGKGEAQPGATLFITCSGE